MPFASIYPALDELGWTPHFNQQLLALVSDFPEFEAFVPARVVVDHGREYELAGVSGPRRGVLSGKLLHELAGERPCVGDFVLVPSGEGTDPVRLEHLFERSSVFRRKAAGGTSGAQPIAANVDVAIIVSALASEDADRHVQQRGLNARRIERYLQAVAEAPARPIVALTKADLRNDAAEQAAVLSRRLGGADVVLTSSVTGQGLDELTKQLGRGLTAVLVGSSGVGKSSLTNRLLGREAQRVEAVRELDTRGRHTTTHRELFVLPGGGLLIDTPGMRELALFSTEASDAAGSGFDDIDRLARDCRFDDCRHEGEPGCAVLRAVERGELEPSRLEHSYKLRRELQWQKRRFDEAARRAERQKRRVQSRQARTRLRAKERSD